VLVQISDLHITEPGALCMGRVDTGAFLRRCVARLLQLTPRPDAVLVTGDLVDLGTVREYEHLRELIAPLAAALPTYLMLGNHDARSEFRGVFDDARYAGDFVHYAFDAGPLRVIALDTHDPGNHGGRLCAARLAFLARALDAAGDRPVVIAMHHPPFASGIAPTDSCLLDAADTAELAAIVARHPRVERVICGHVHRSMTARFAGTIAQTAPSCAHQVALTFGDVPGAWTLEPPGFLQHVWMPPAGALVSHHTYVEVAETRRYGE
jgi:3',5'-cyclic AMP phosphodiesterase CpdA